jgi:hypothetical protein
MTEAARAAGKSQLIRSAEEWTSLVLPCMEGNGFNKFNRDITFPNRTAAIRALSKCPMNISGGLRIRRNRWDGEIKRIFNER